MLRGQAKKDYQRDYMKKRRGLTATPENVRPVLDPLVRPSVIGEVKRLYPESKLPNCPDGRYRPYSKEEQLGVKMSKRQAKKIVAFDELKTKYDVRLING